MNWPALGYLRSWCLQTLRESGTAPKKSSVDCQIDGYEPNGVSVLRGKKMPGTICNRSCDRLPLKKRNKCIYLRDQMQNCRISNSNRPSKYASWLASLKSFQTPGTSGGLKMPWQTRMRMLYKTGFKKIALYQLLYDYFTRIGREINHKQFNLDSTLL